MCTSVVVSADSANPESGACGTLVVAQPAVPRIRDRRVREQQLARRETAGPAFGDAGAIAKERDLDAEIVSVAVAHPGRDVPPLGAEQRVAAVVARKREYGVRRDCRVADLRAGTHAGKHKRDRPGTRAGSPIVLHCVDGIVAHRAARADQRGRRGEHQQPERE